jgi:hypothetical protein
VPIPQLGIQKPRKAAVPNMEYNGIKTNFLQQKRVPYDASQRFRWLAQ